MPRKIHVHGYERKANYVRPHIRSYPKHINIHHHKKKKNKRKIKI